METKLIKDKAGPALLTESAVALGRTWAEEQRASLHRDGRAASGGWPGTLREARMRVERLLLQASISPRSLALVTADDREEAARAAYASARQEWCRRAEPETG
jgi:hypothetical protein